MKSKKIRRVDSNIQAEMFSGVPASIPQSTQLTNGFVDPDPELLSLGSLRLREFLEQSHVVLPIRIREIVREIDFTSFTQKYNLSGRAPYHPAIIMGLVIYGIMKNEGSLRQLESLATMDVGAHWITGGVILDHMTIGRFLQIHSDTITPEFFETLTCRLIKKMASPTHDWPIGGNIIESAGSRFRTLKLEVAAQSAVQDPPDAPNDDTTSTDHTSERT